MFSIDYNSALASFNQTVVAHDFAYANFVFFADIKKRNYLVFY